MPIAIAVLLGLAALLIVIYPLLGVDPSAEMAVRDAISEVSEQEVSAKQALRDVDFDRRLGNLDDEDYHDLRDRFEESALEAMKSRYERERELDLAIDRQLQSLSAERPASPVSQKAARTATRGLTGSTAAASTKAPKSTDAAESPSNGTSDADRRAALRKRRGV